MQEPEIDRHLAHSLADLDLTGLRDLFPDRMKLVDGELSQPFVAIDNPGYDPELALYPEELQGRLMVDTIHSGDLVPQGFVDDLVGNSGVKDAARKVRQSYLREKDWGANQLSVAIVKCLNLRHCHYVTLSRAVLDYGRFPGVTLDGPNATHLYRKAINYPFTELGHPQKMSLLSDYYNEVSRRVENVVRGKVLKISIHTYDPYDDPDELDRRRGARPDISLAFSPIGYHVERRMPKGIFDPLFPDELGAFSADRRLIARLTLNFEREGIVVAYNYPYHLPEGSVEVRAQVWTFFEHLRRCFQRDRPETVHDVAYRLVWDLLLDTNFRSPDAEVLRSYIHMFREVPTILFGLQADSTSEVWHLQEILADRLEESRLAYEEVRQYLKAGWDELVTAYRRSPERPSALVLEVRKDILWRYEDDTPVEGPEGLRIDGLKKMAFLISKAILRYLHEDRKLEEHASAHLF